MRKRMLLLLLALFALFIAGCGGQPKADVQIFIMTANGMSGDQAEALETSLKARVGDKPTISINASPMFSMEKVLVEVVGGENSIIIVPGQQFEAFGKQGGYMNLDGLFEDGQYNEGVFVNAETKEEHLYGIPLHEVKWFKDSGYIGEEIFAFIPQNAKHKENAKKVLKAMTEE